MIALTPVCASTLLAPTGLICCTIVLTAWYLLQGRALNTHAEAPANAYSGVALVAPVSTAGVAGGGIPLAPCCNRADLQLLQLQHLTVVLCTGTMLRGSNLRKRTMKKDPRLDLQVRLAATMWLHDTVYMFMNQLSLPALCGVIAKDPAAVPRRCFTFQVEFTEASSKWLLRAGTSKVDGQKSRGGVVGLMRGAAKGFFQQIRVGKHHNHFL